MLFKFVICFIAGIGAGLGTGFAGMSAAAVISPILITFLDIDPYVAVGIALASDVLASAASAYTYGKNKNLDIKNGIVMMVTVLCFTMIGSFVSSKVESTAMGNMSTLMTLLLGVKFVIKPVMTSKEDMSKNLTKKQRTIRAVLGGTMIGFICGFVGAGGGMMMLLILVSVLGYELKTAVGTSVFIMSFTAFTGSVSHMVIGGKPDLWTLIFCVLSTLLWAQIAAKIANKSTPKVLNRVTGIVLIIIGLFTTVFKYVA